MEKDNLMVVAVVDVRVEVVVEDWLMGDPVRFSTYYLLDFDHRS